MVGERRPLFKFASPKNLITPTSALIIANVLVYAYTSVVSGDLLVINNEVLLWLGQDNVFVMNGGYWQLLTSMFVHINILHLFGNMVFLLIFGLRAEDLFSAEEFFFIYFMSGLLGNLLTLLSGPIVSAGASGAIFGMFGACVIYLRRTFGGSIIGALIFSFYLLMLTTSAGVNIIAHFGGLLAGLIIGYVLAKNREFTF